MGATPVANQYPREAPGAIRCSPRFAIFFPRTHVPDSSPITISVSAEEATKRLDQFLTAHLQDISRARVQEMIATEKILINGAPAKPSLKLRGGEQITVLAPAERPPLR